MDKLILKVQQLDLAARLLKKRDGVYGRLALILVDNVVELLLHEFAIMRISSKYLKDPVVSSWDEQKALGRYFEDKLKYAMKVKMIIQDEYLFCLRAHDLRNDAYHAGVLNEEIIADVAWYYHEIACKFLLILRPNSYTHSLNRRIPREVKKHLVHSGLVENRYIFGAGFEKLTESISKEKPRRKRKLGVATSKSLKKRLKKIREKLKYLLDGGEGGKTLNAVIKTVQKWDSVSGTPRLNVLKIQEWIKRAGNLKSEINPGVVLEKHRKIIEDISVFEESISKYVSAFDEFIDRQIDEARGN